MIFIRLGLYMVILAHDFNLLNRLKITHRLKSTGNALTYLYPFYPLDKTFFHR